MDNWGRGGIAGLYPQVGQLLLEPRLRELARVRHARACADPPLSAAIVQPTPAVGSFDRAGPAHTVKAMWMKRLLAFAALVVVMAAVVVVVHGRGGSERDAAASAASATSARTPEARRAKPKPTPPAGEVRGAAARRMAVPILMYHVISKAPVGVPNAQLWVDRHVFADELRALRAAKFQAVTLQQVYDAWKHGGPLPKHPIVVSFDDGYLSHYTHAKPVLRALGWPGVLNLHVDVIGPGGLTSKQIRSLIAAGWEVDSHTLTHPDLTTLDDRALKRELVDSRRELRKRFGVRADFLAYPAGRYDARVEAAARAAGYKAATTVDEGMARGRDDLFALKRVRVNGSDTAETLLARLNSSRG
jgi:peptidoglycan/xylan/chitin deacetylase (PgdA/CDA1 family)